MELSRCDSATTIFMSRCSGESGGTEPCSAWTEPEMDARGLRISCAMPAASSPTAASLSLRRTSPSSRLTCVTFWKIRMRPTVYPVPSRRADEETPKYASCSLMRRVVSKRRISEPAAAIRLQAASPTRPRVWTGRPTRSTEGTPRSSCAARFANVTSPSGSVVRTPEDIEPRTDECSACRRAISDLRRSRSVRVSRSLFEEYDTRSAVTTNAPAWSATCPTRPAGVQR